MQLTGWDNGNWMRNATCVETQTSKVLTQVDLLSIPYNMLVKMITLFVSDRRNGRQLFESWFGLKMNDLTKSKRVGI